MEIYKRLAALQAEISNPKNTTENPFYKSKYAPLPEILELARPLLAKHGLAVLQYPETRKDDITMVGVRTMVLLGQDADKTEEAVIDCGWLGLPSQGLDAQKVGAVITYFRRYALKAVLGIESEDDDANSAVASPEKRAGKKEQTAPAQPTGNVQAIKAAWAASKTDAEQDAVLAGANGMTWTDVDYQELAIFFDTELSKRAARKAKDRGAAPAPVDEQATLLTGEK